MVERVVHGGGDENASLKRYKEQFLFHLQSVPWFTAREPVYRLCARAFAAREALRTRLQLFTVKARGQDEAARSVCKTAASELTPRKDSSSGDAQRGA